MTTTKDLVKALLKPEAYDEKVEKIKLVQTYHSYIFLTGRYAYKIKKAVKFPYFDFTTIEKRKRDLEKELKLNLELSPELYIGIVPITEEDGKIKICGGGKVVEYALKMIEVPQRFLLSNILKRGYVDKDTITRIARIIYDFHSRTKTNRKIKKFGSIKMIKFNWRESLDQVKEFVGQTISEDCFSLIKQKVYNFFQ